VICKSSSPRAKVWIYLVTNVLLDYNSDYLQEQEDKSSSLKKHHKLTVDKDRTKVVWIDRDVDSTFFYWIKISFINDCYNWWLRVKSTKEPCIRFIQENLMKF